MEVEPGISQTIQRFPGIIMINIEFLNSFLIRKVPESKTNTGKSYNREIIRKNLRNFGNGILIGILLYIRIDLLVFYAAIFCPILFWYISKWRRLFSLQFIVITIGVLLGIGSGATDDYYSYGHFFISPKQWFLFNVFSNNSNTFFGEFNITFYFTNILFHNAAMILLLFLTFLLLTIVTVKKFKTSNILIHHCTNTSLFLAFSAIIVFISFSLKGHKEMRFLHNFVVLILIVYASTLRTMLCCIYCSKVLSTSWKNVLNSGVVLFLLVYVKQQWDLFPSGKSIANWSYLNNFESGNINPCLYYVHLQDNVTGVFLDESLFFSGAYSLLHKDVPLFSLIHTEFYEFSKDSRVSIKYQFGSLKSGNLNQRTQVSALSNISDYVSIYNHPYLMKRLVSNDDSVYNYLIVKNFRKFINFGFKLVFQSGTIKVLKKVKTIKSKNEKKKKFVSFLKQLPSISESNSTVSDILVHEGHLLYSFGLYDKAEERLLEALQYTPNRVAIYQLLFNIYQYSARFSLSKHYWNSCIEISGEEECKKPVSFVDLHTFPSSSLAHGR